MVPGQGAAVMHSSASRSDFLVAEGVLHTLRCFHSSPNCCESKPRPSIGFFLSQAPAERFSITGVKTWGFVAGVEMKTNLHSGRKCTRIGEPPMNKGEMGCLKS